MTSRQAYMLKIMRGAIATAYRRHKELDDTDVLFAVEFIRVVVTEEMIKRHFPNLRPNVLDKRKPYA